MRRPIPGASCTSLRSSLQWGDPPLHPPGWTGQESHLLHPAAANRRSPALFYPDKPILSGQRSRVISGCPDPTPRQPVRDGGRRIAGRRPPIWISQHGRAAEKPLVSDSEHHTMVPGDVKKTGDSECCRQDDIRPFCGINSGRRGFTSAKNTVITKGYKTDTNLSPGTIKPFWRFL